MILSPASEFEVDLLLLCSVHLVHLAGNSSNHCGVSSGDTTGVIGIGKFCHDGRLRGVGGKVVVYWGILKSSPSREIYLESEHSCTAEVALWNLLPVGATLVEAVRTVSLWPRATIRESNKEQ